MPRIDTLPSPLSTVHIMGIGGTAMGALAGMLHDAGLVVTGSDTGVYPPMSDYLASLGIDVMLGYEAKNLEHRPDLVVVGNVIRKDYPEALALLAGDLPYTSLPELLGHRFLEGRRNIVVAGTHGKTTTTAIISWLLESAGRQPGFLIGGLAGNFDRTARAPARDHFVIEGDEYDTAFFDKVPKFVHYRPKTALLTSIEFDHADIYRDLEHVIEAFEQLVVLVPADGVLVARTDHAVVERVSKACKGEIRGYGVGQEWDGRVDAVDTETGRMTFSVLHAGRVFGQFESSMVGTHNLYNQVAAVASLDAEGLGVEELKAGFSTFLGIKRRQEIIGQVGGVTVIDDFAHHPTAVELTLDALRQRFGTRRLWAIFEPRSNTSRRNVFQEAYAEAFGASDIAVIAPPLNVAGIEEADRFDPNRLVSDLHKKGAEAFVWGQDAGPGELSAEAVAETIATSVAANVLPEDVVAILSNGGFGGLHQRLIGHLRDRFAPPA